jgi:AcrR family transcriptional regulator
VTVADICAAAQIAPRTFFRYFASKEQVLSAPVHEMADRLAEWIAAAPEDADDVEVLRRGLRALGEQIVEPGGTTGIAFRLMRDAEATSGGPLISLDEHEQRLAGLLVGRHGRPAEPDWRLRVEVAQVLAAFRVWLVDFAGSSHADALGHLDEVLAHR